MKNLCPGHDDIEKHEHFGTELCEDCALLFKYKYQSDKKKLLDFILQQQLRHWKRKYPHK